MYDLTNKTILITGASRGLGLQLTRQLWQHGAHLILTARSHETLIDIQSNLLANAQPDQSIQIVPIDLAGPDAIEQLLEVLPTDKIDVLINNAATLGPVGPFWENDWQSWQKALRVNLTAPIELCQKLIPFMIKRRSGKIINLSGGGATGPRPGFSAYAVAKVGLARFSETLAEEVKPYHIQVNCVAPGRMNTNMLNEIIQAGEKNAGEKEVRLAKQDGSACAIDKATALCVFLCSPASQTITGKLISAVWDPWHDLGNYLDDLNNSDIYTLRRILPKDRQKNWGTP